MLTLLFFLLFSLFMGICYRRVNRSRSSFLFHFKLAYHLYVIHGFIFHLSSTCVDYVHYMRSRFLVVTYFPTRIYSVGDFFNFFA